MKASTMKDYDTEKKAKDNTFAQKTAKTLGDNLHIPIDNVGPSPTNSDGTDGSVRAFKSPNALRRNVIPAKSQKDSQNLIFKAFPQVRHFRLLSDSSPFNGEPNSATFQQNLTPEIKLQKDYIEHTAETERNLITEGTLPERTQRGCEEKESDDSEEK